MQTQPLEEIIAELKSADWLKAGCAIRKVLPFGGEGEAAFPALFALTLHDMAPLVSDSRAVFKRLGASAVPFLRSMAEGDCDRGRASAVALLMEAGRRSPTSTYVDEQILDPRDEELPDWGADPEEVFALFLAALKDESLTVRFAAASALEEFGRHLELTVPVFVETLENGAAHQRQWSALRLGRIGAPAVAALDALENATRHPAPMTALAAANALKRIAPSDGLI